MSTTSMIQMSLSGTDFIPFICKHTSFHCALLTQIIKSVLFLKLQGQVTPALSKSIGAYFSNICSLHNSVTFGNSHAISSFSLCQYLLWWFVTEDLLYYSGFGHQQIMPVYDRREL